MCDLQPTQSPPCSMELTPPDDNIKIPWGRLISRIHELDAVDLVTDAVSLGRSEHCDIVIYKNKFPEDIVLNISKEHFVISKESEGPVFITDLSKNGTFINRQKVGKNNKYILQNNDVISVGHRQLIIYTFKQMDSLDDTYLPAELRRKYENGTLLGRGAVGEVRLIYEKTTCKKYAVKKIRKGKFTPSHLKEQNHPNKIYGEINILRSINHPCIISMREIVETPEDVFIILEYMEGGELTSRIEKLNMSESLVKFYFYQIMLAVNHLHENKITHRDLKPENVLLSSKRLDCIVKISDFGLSKESEDNIMNTMCGTMNYVAPEVIDGHFKEYNNQVDVWSLGVILYYMMSKAFPFNASEKRSLGRLILQGSFTMIGPKWRNASIQVKDLIRRMLTVNPKERITLREIFQHPWISRDIAMQRKVNNLIESQELIQNPEPNPKRIRVDGNDATPTTSQTTPTLTHPIPLPQIDPLTTPTPSLPPPRVETIVSSPSLTPPLPPSTTVTIVARPSLTPPLPPPTTVTIVASPSLTPPLPPPTTVTIVPSPSLTPLPTAVTMPVEGLTIDDLIITPKLQEIIPPYNPNE